MKAQPGDILLFEVNKTSNILDRAIAWGQHVIRQAPTKIGVSYCHVGLVGPDEFHYYEARWPVVRLTELGWDTLFKSNPIDVFRVKGITQAEVNQVLQAAATNVGEPYDIGALFFGLFPAKHRVVCSTFVWQCFNSAGIKLCPLVKLDSPDDLAVSDRLERVFG